MKKLVSICLIGALMVSLAGCAKTDKKQEEYILQIGTVLNEADPLYVALTEVFEKQVEEKTNGAIDVQIYSGGQLGTDEDVLEQALASPDFLIELATRLKTEKAKNAQLTVSNQIMQPKADYFDMLVDRNLLTGIRDTAKELGIRQNDFVRFLLDKGYLFRTKKGKLRPYATYVDSGLFEMKEFVNDKTGYMDTQTLITPKGKETFRLLCI